MANKKNTKKALLSSVLSLVLCMAMLIGTTFAWFTDSVTSKNNIIKSGNLDVTLDYYNEETKEFEEVSKNVALFDSEALWEPGYTEVAYLKVGNAGSLALKYQLQVNVYDEITGLTKDGKEIKLSDYLVFSVIDIDETEAGTYTRETAIEKAGDAKGLKEYIGETKPLVKNGDADYVALVIYMPTTVGNEANHNGKDIPQIEMGVNLYATQFTSEEDSFDEMYDEGAWMKGMMVYTAAELESALPAGGSVKLGAPITVDEPIVIPEGVTTYLDLNGMDFSATDPQSSYVINNLGTLVLRDSGATGKSRAINARGIYNGYSADGNYVSTAKLTIENGVYNAMGANGGAAVYNYGILNIKSGTFTSKGGYALNNQPSGVMTVSNASVTGGIYNCGELTVNNSTVYQHISGRHAIYNWAAKLVINSGEFDSESGNELILADGQGSNVVINGGTFDKTAKSWLFGAATGKNISFVINGGVFNGYVNKPENTVDTIRPYGDPIVVNGGTFNFNPTNWLASGYKAVAVDGAYVAVPADYELVSAGLFQNEQGEYIVTTGAGLASLNAKWNTTSRKALTIRLGADIDFAGYTWKTVDSHVDQKYGYLKEFDGQGYVITNLTVQGQAMFRRFAGSGDVTIKNVTFDNANVNSNGSINTSILVGQSYQNVLLDNVDVVNSTIIGGYKVAPLMGTVYNENASTITATLKNCDVKDTVVKATSYDFCTTGMVAFVYEDNNDKVVFENCTVSDVYITAPNVYTAHAWVYTTGSDTLYNEVEGVTVSGCTFETLK